MSQGVIKQVILFTIGIAGVEAASLPFLVACCAFLLPGQRNVRQACCFNTCNVLLEQNCYGICSFVIRSMCCAGGATSRVARPA